MAKKSAPAPEPTKPLTKAQVVAAVVEKSGLSKKDVVAAFDAIADVAAEQLKSAGKVTVPDLATLKLVEKPATKEKAGVNPFTKEPMTVKAKPASKKVRVVPLSAFSRRFDH